ncbi:hypothetical protein C5167_021029 [Papaver somniferum]|uniref:Uncharacterized protein n=1 Tax=Papaver somniferum TaxID=3469 RepID=A0A4Y7IXY0_PAPSO|nr:hypothetical protein C5167_021029 [Papaver somniferum]
MTSTISNNKNEVTSHLSNSSSTEIMLFRVFHFSVLQFCSV